MDYQRWVLRTHPRDLDGHDGSPEVLKNLDFQSYNKLEKFLSKLKAFHYESSNKFTVDPNTIEYGDFFWLFDSGKFRLTREEHLEV